MRLLCVVVLCCCLGDRLLCVLQEPHLGEQGMLGSGLSHDQRLLLQRFHPRMKEGMASDGHASMPRLDEANSDTIGFFIAKFIKS